MSFDLQFAINDALPLAIAAYDPTKIPSDWKLVTKIEPQDFGFVATRINTITGKKELVIAYCGTRDALQWMHDFDELVIPFPYGAGHAHLGMLQEYMSVRASVWAAIPADVEQIYIVAHSLGASMGSYCALDIANNMPNRPPIAGYTFEGPRCGWFDFANDFDTKVSTWYRIVNRWDVVPCFPDPLIGYRHVGTAININGGLTFDLRTAHSLTLSCAPGLAALAAKSAG